MSILGMQSVLNHMEYVDKIVYTYTFQHCLTTRMHNSLFLMDEALLSISRKFGVIQMQMLITLESLGLFCSNFVYVFI